MSSEDEPTFPKSINDELSKEEDPDEVILRIKKKDFEDNFGSKISILSAPLAPVSYTKSDSSDEIRIDQSFLDSSELIPNDFWATQRDSFIHRSYNEKLASRNNANEYPKRPVSVPLADDSICNDPIKRDSFIRHSIKSIRKSFNKNIKRKSDGSVLQLKNDLNCITDNDSNNNENSGEIRKCPHTINNDELTIPNATLESLKKCHSRNNSTSSCASNRSTNSVSHHSTNSMAPLQSQSDTTHTQPSVTLSRSPSQNSAKVDLKSNKPVVASNPRSSSPHSTKTKNDIPEKEKKRKELSSGRQKKFHRHFQQVAADERVINYYSCALVSDILLQGHLYITDNYFAFYSNVFGFVTKLLIPTVSVVKISKEKTAKIIPNAVGVATADERHVFGSFMSRESAYRLMLSVWAPVAPVEPEIPLKIPDVEASECSVEDDSSSAISGNESPPRILESTASDASQSLRQRSASSLVIDSSNAAITYSDNINIPVSKFLDPPSVTTSTSLQPQSPPQPLSTSPSPKIVFYQPLPLPQNLLYVGVIVAVLLSLLSGLLLYRIMDVKARINNHNNINPLDFKWNTASKDIDIYAEVLKWQKEMQSKSVDEAQIILNTNLEQIAKVRRSLETLSILIHDKNSPSMLGDQESQQQQLYASSADAESSSATLSSDTKNNYDRSKT